MASNMKIRAKLKGDTVEVKALMNHPMETGLRKDKKTGEVIPAHFIKDVVATSVPKSGEKTVVMTALWSGGVSKNPYIAFKFTGAGAAKGDSIELTWTDNAGGTETGTAEIK